MMFDWYVKTLQHKASQRLRLLNCIFRMKMTCKNVNIWPSHVLLVPKKITVTSASVIIDIFCPQSEILIRHFNSTYIFMMDSILMVCWISYPTNFWWKRKMVWTNLIVCLCYCTKHMEKQKPKGQVTAVANVFVMIMIMVISFFSVHSALSEWS